MSDPSNTGADAPDLGTVPVSDLNQFVTLLTRWHSNRVQVLQHLTSIPDGAEMQSKGKDGKEQTVVLTGDLHTGFIAGIEVALMELGTLPFVAETGDTDAAD